MGRRGSRAARSSGSAERQGPLKQRFFFQELPQDIQQMVLEGVMFRLSRDPLGEDVGLLHMDNLLHEEADDIINRNNFKRTVTQWLEFAENTE